LALVGQDRWRKESDHGEIGQAGFHTSLAPEGASRAFVR